MEFGRCLSEGQTNRVAVDSDSACSPPLWDSEAHPVPSCALQLQYCSSQVGMACAHPAPVRFVEQQSKALWFGNEGLQVWAIGWRLPCYPASSFYRLCGASGPGSFRLVLGMPEFGQHLL